MNESTKQKISYAAAMGVAALSMPLSAQAAIVINEVYAGGASSNTTTSFQQDFFELFNNGTAAVDVSNWVFQYASAAGAFPTTSTSSNSVTLGSNVQISPGSFFLIAGGANTTAGAALPTPDQTSAIQAGATAGKVQLLNGTTVIDLVGYGSATTFEGTAAALSPSITTSISRVAGLDTNNNFSDFVVTPPTPTPGVPEPTTLGLAAGAALLLARRRR